MVDKIKLLVKFADTHCRMDYPELNPTQASTQKDDSPALADAPINVGKALRDPRASGSSAESSSV
jgi:hypothetical protein